MVTILSMLDHADNNGAVAEIHRHDAENPLPRLTKPRSTSTAPPLPGTAAPPQADQAVPPDQAEPALRLLTEPLDPHLYLPEDDLHDDHTAA